MLNNFLIEALMNKLSVRERIVNVII